MRVGRRPPIATTLLLVIPIAACSGGRATTSQTSGTVLRGDQATVTGTVTTAHVEDAVAAALTLPLTITIPVRGNGGAHIQTGQEAIAWDGGQPLPISGTGSIDLGPANLDADSTGATWHLDGRPRRLTPGDYVLSSSVAVGTSGLAQPQDRATFAVTSSATLVTVGDASVHEPSAPLHLQGPGNMTLRGDLNVTTAQAHTRVRSVQFGNGPFDVHLTPTAGGYTLVGLLQGPLSTA